MSSKGYTVGTYIIKSEKKNSDLPMCPICKKGKEKEHKVHLKLNNINFRLILK